MVLMSSGVLIQISVVILFMELSFFVYIFLQQYMKYSHITNWSMLVVEFLHEDCLSSVHILFGFLTTLLCHIVSLPSFTDTYPVHVYWLYDCTNIKKIESKNFPTNVIVEKLGLIDMWHAFQLFTNSYEYTSYPVWTRGLASGSPLSSLLVL
jgi:hypothetical protein